MADSDEFIADHELHFDFQMPIILLSDSSDSDYFMDNFSSDSISYYESSDSASESNDEVPAHGITESITQPGEPSRRSDHMMENSNPPISLHTADSNTLCERNDSVPGDKASQEKSGEKAANVSILSQSSDEEGQICSICFERWTNSDNHRLSSLKCGHIFGHSCISKWLSGQGKKCPQCNIKAKRSDIRIIYAKSLKALDTSERDRALRELEQEKEIRRKVEIERYQLKLQCDKMRDECTKLQTRISLYQNHGSFQMIDESSVAAGSSTLNSKSTNAMKFHFHKEILVSKTGHCRVLSYCDGLNMIAVSQPNTSTLFPGYGVKKISSIDFKTAELIYLHSNVIRDIAFKPDTSGAMLLSVSQDKSLKLSNMLNNSVVQEYKYDTPLWSCAWNLDNLDQFFAGTTNGRILLYDTRNTSKCLEVISSGSSAPVVSMKYVKEKCNASFKYGGLLVCQLDQVTFHQVPFDDAFKQFSLPIRGSFTSVDFDNSTRQFLLSSRPHPDFPLSRHLMGELRCTDSYSNSSSQPFITSNILQTINGGKSHKMLSRSKFVTYENDSSGEQMFVCAGDESSSSFMLWDVSTGHCSEKFPTSSPVLDIGTATVSNSQFLLTLTDKMLSIYRIE